MKFKIEELHKNKINKIIFNDRPRPIQKLKTTEKPNKKCNYYYY